MIDYVVKFYPLTIVLFIYYAISVILGFSLIPARWYELEAFILDEQYLEKLQEQNSDCIGAFCGYREKIDKIWIKKKNTCYLECIGSIKNGRISYPLL